MLNQVIKEEERKTDKENEMSIEERRMSALRESRSKESQGTLIQAKKRLTAFILLYCVCQKARNSKSAYMFGCCRSFPISWFTSRVRNMWKPTATMESCYHRGRRWQRSQWDLKGSSKMKSQG